LPEAARAYLRRLEILLGIPVDIISTGPGREAIVFRSHPFD
jgi:adenylosuccinate synthase